MTDKLQIEADAECVRSVLDDALALKRPHASGAFQAIDRLEAVALSAIETAAAADAHREEAELTGFEKFAARVGRNRGPGYVVMLTTEEAHELLGLYHLTRAAADEWSDRFDLLTIDHEVTKGYRQHAEQQLGEAREALDKAWSDGVYAMATAVEFSALEEGEPHHGVSKALLARTFAKNPHRRR